MSIFKKKLTLQIAFLFFLPLHLLFAHESVFELTYKIRLNGLSCGQMSFSLNKVGKDTYQAKQVWLSKVLFFPLDQMEMSDFSIINNDVLPEKYTFSRQQVASKKHYAYLFSEEEKERNQFDRLSFQMIIMKKLLENTGLKESQVTLVDDKGLYKITPIVEQKNGQTKVFFAYKNREHEILFDEKIEHLPIRFTQKRGPLHFEGELESKTINKKYWSKKY